MASPPSNSFTQVTIAGDPDQGKNRAITAVDLALRDAGETVEPPRGLYAHIPFCFHKCHYCDFYSIVDSQDRMVRFVERMAEEIEASRPYLTAPISTIFVGGGTPTLLPSGPWRDLLAAFATIPWAPDLEFTVEANPETVTAQLVETLVRGGVNRMSVGAQSFLPRHLKTLERHHDPERVGRAIEIARSAGLSNVSLDLIFGIPGQTVDEWTHDLDAALALSPDHISCYGLMYEPNTAMTARLARGEFERVDHDTEAEMYETTVRRLDRAGFEQYEISNWARPGRRCRHNLVYWRDRAWWPLGPSAAGAVGGWRWRNVPRIASYLDHGPLPLIVDVERVDDDVRVGEALMLGLRLNDGIDADRLEELLARGTRGDERRDAITGYLETELLERTAEGTLRFTAGGRLLADTVLCDLI